MSTTTGYRLATDNALMAKRKDEAGPIEREDTFGWRLLKAIQLRGGPVEQEAVSKWLNDEHKIRVSGAMINKYKNDDKLPRMEQCRQYAVALGVTIEWLYTGRRPMELAGPLDAREEEILKLLRAVEPESLRTSVAATLIGHLNVELGRPARVVPLHPEKPRRLAASARQRPRPKRPSA